MRKNRLLIFITSFIILFFIFLIIFYIKILPICISNTKVISYIENNLKKHSDYEIIIKKPCLKTGFTPNISFKLDKLIILKNNNSIFSIENLNTKISMKNLLKNKIIIDRFETDYIFADVNKLMKLFPEQQKDTKKKPNIELDFYNSVLSLKRSLILYEIESGYNVNLKINDFNIDNTKKKERFLHFDIDTFIKKNNKSIHFSINDKNKVVLKNKHIYMNDCILNINNSNVHINANASKKNGVNIDLISKNFKIEDIVDIVNSNIIINNGSDILLFFSDIKGDFDFNINLTKNNLNGIVNLNKGYLKIIPLNNLPIIVNKGKLLISTNDIILENFYGYYGSKKINKATLNGVIKDYAKSCDTNLTIKTFITNDFTKNYLSKMINTQMEMIGKAPAKIIINSIYNKIDIIMMSKVAKGDDILIEKSSFSPKGYDRALKADLHFENNILNIKNINYYIAEELKKGVKVKPVMILNGNIDCSDPIPYINDFSFNIPNPLPSEFLNVFIGQKVFKGGKFQGNLGFINKNQFPVIKGNMEAYGIRIPKQRLYIKNAKINTYNSKLINIIADGRYKRSKYDFNGSITNEIKYPIIIKDVNFKIDNIDIDRLLKSFNEQNTSSVNQKSNINNNIENNDTDNNNVTFDVNNLIIERCILRLNEGKYQDINFGNLEASLTLNKNNILEIKSNKFNIAEGISTLKVFCDLKKHKYNIRLGIKDVNSDIMSSSLLNLRREISGKASGLIELNTDENLKLNGTIKFLVKNGQIQKIGLVEYILKLAALFRNPFVMISPSIISDIVNLPEGNFDKIQGELFIKNNFVELLKIRSSSPQLASYIVGCYNIENSDTILRIYTKFSNKNKGFGGFLRNISLNSLAHRIPLSSRNEFDYYSSELSQIPSIDADEKDCQIFLTKVDGDLEHNNFISSLKKIK